MKSQFYYLIHVQYLGFRFHGWAKQPDLKTVHHMIDRTIRYVMGKGAAFKTLGSSRTDAKVSAAHTAFELFTETEVSAEQFVRDVNDNLPSDIRILKMESVDETFNVIQAPRKKHYQYLFTYGEKPHPFCAPLMAYFPWELDVALMKHGAEVFLGEHNFRKYCTKPTEQTVFRRKIFHSEITSNEEYQANFFPPESFIYSVVAPGFMRHQIRLMVGQLVSLGRGDISLDDLKSSLTHPDDIPLKNIAPASGLILQDVSFD